MVMDEVLGDARLSGSRSRRAMLLLKRGHHLVPCSGGG